MTDWIDRQEQWLREQRDSGMITEMEFEEAMKELWTEDELYEQSVTSCTDCHCDLDLEEETAGVTQCQECEVYEREVLRAEQEEERQRFERQEMTQHYERHPHG